MKWPSEFLLGCHQAIDKGIHSKENWLSFILKGGSVLCRTRDRMVTLKCTNAGKGPFLVTFSAGLLVFERLNSKSVSSTSLGVELTSVQRAFMFSSIERIEVVILYFGKWRKQWTCNSQSSHGAKVISVIHRLASISISQRITTPFRQLTKGNRPF